MSLQPCKILALLAPNCFTVQNLQNKTLQIGSPSNGFLTKDGPPPTAKALELYRKQMQYVGRDAVYSAKLNTLKVEDQDIFENLGNDQGPEALVTQPDSASFIREKRFKEIEGILVSAEYTQLNFLVQNSTEGNCQLLSVIPHSIYLDEFAAQDGQLLKFLQKDWLSKVFVLNFKSLQLLTAPGKASRFQHIQTLSAELHWKDQGNIQISNQFYCALVSAGLAYITDVGKVALPSNSLQLLFQSQEEAKTSKLGLWRNGELDRRLLNQVSAQLEATVMEVVEANHIIVDVDRELKHIHLSNITVEGIEAKEFARKLLIGKRVQILRIGEQNPSYAVRIGEIDVEETIVANGWGVVKEGKCNLSKTKQETLVQLGHQAKHKKLGQYSLEISWRIEDQTDQRNGRNVNDFIWQQIQREDQLKKANQQQGFTTAGANLYDVVVEKIFEDNNMMHISVPKFNSLLKFQLHGIVSFSRFASSFPQIVKYDIARFKFMYETLMQRNVFIQFESYVMKENYLTGRIFSKKNVPESDCVIEMLRQGITFLSSTSNYYKIYADAQGHAQQQRIGIWSEPYADMLLEFTLNNVKSKPKTIKEGNIQKQETQNSSIVMITEILDTQEFYVRLHPNPQFEQIEQQIFEFKQLTPLAKPVKKGTLCLAKFSEDGKLYRAQVTQVFKGDEFLVKFIDYGNDDRVSYPDLAMLPENLAVIPRQAKLSGLAYLRLPYPAHPFAEEAAQLFRDQVWDQVLVAKVAYTERSGSKQFLMLYLQGVEGEVKNSINAALVENGVARIETKVLENPLKHMMPAQRAAQDAQRGLWSCDDQLDDINMFEDDLTYYQS